jgi:DNA-directed RNA polymerase subunit RPC12/RpoP
VPREIVPMNELIAIHDYMCPNCGMHLIIDVRKGFRDYVLYHPENPGMYCSGKVFAMPKTKVIELGPVELVSGKTGADFIYIKER